MTVANGLMIGTEANGRANLTQPELPPDGSPEHFVYTTGKVSKICRVASRTVSKWIDSGKLKGYRLPGSQDRRVSGSDLLEFMRANGMGALIPYELQRNAAARPVAIIHPPGMLPEIEYMQHGFRPFLPASEFDLGAWLQHPVNAEALVVIGTADGTRVASKLARRVLLSAPRVSIVVGFTLTDQGEQGFAELTALQPRVTLVEADLPGVFLASIARALKTNVKGN